MTWKSSRREMPTALAQDQDHGPVLILRNRTRRSTDIQMKKTCRIMRWGKYFSVKQTLGECCLKKVSSRWVRGAPSNSTVLIIPDDENNHNFTEMMSWGRINGSPRFYN
jgi:hypothetical protein